MTDFFGALQLELRAAGQRAPRRWAGAGDLAGVIAATGLVAAAVVVALVVMGGGQESSTAPPAVRPDPVGTVIPKGEGKPPRPARSVVVAAGTAPGVGSWQMEASRSSVLKDPGSGEVYQRAGLRCISLVPVGPRQRLSYPAAGQCGEFPRTPGFSRLQLPGAVLRPDGERAHRLRKTPVLVFGRVPERAARVVVTAPDGLRIEARPHEGPPSARGDFYAISVPRGHQGARVNWLNRYGKPGSRGAVLMPPITR